MVFKEKLTFLMGITGTNNRQLAKAIMVDPSLVSRLCSGKRTPPNNAEYIKSIADYFSTRVNSDLQMDILTRAIGESYIDFSDKEKSTKIIESWLANNDTVSQSYGNMLLQSFEGVTSPVCEEFAEEIYPLNTIHNDKKQQVYNFYGNEGKQQATLFFLELVLSAKKTSEIKIANGNNTEWLWKNRDFSKQLSSCIKKAVMQGHTLTRIIPSDQNVTMSFDTVNRWLPLYSTGKVHSYYYPYHRDKIFSRTLYVAPEIAALFSTSIGNQPESGLTILTTNPEMISALELEINDYLDLCLPATTFYNFEKSYDELYECVSNFYAYQSECINFFGGLSYITTPKEVLLDFAQHSVNVSPFTLEYHFDSELADVERLLKIYRYTEFIYIDSFEDIISGKAKSCAINGETFFYTPKAYIKHLNNIITMLKQYENYHVVLIRERLFESCVYVKHGYCALSFLYNSPYSVCITKNLSLIDAVWEYGKNEMDQGVSADTNKLQVMMNIDKLLLQLNDYVCGS